MNVLTFLTLDLCNCKHYRNVIVNTTERSFTLDSSVQIKLNISIIIIKSDVSFCIWCETMELFIEKM